MTVSTTDLLDLLAYAGQLDLSIFVREDEDGYYVASVPALRGCHTQARSLDALMKRIKEAIELCLEVDI